MQRNPESEKKAAVNEQMTAMTTIHNNISNWTNGSNLSRILKERHIREPVQRTQKCSNWGQIKLRCGIEHSANDWNSAGTGGSFLFGTSSHKYVSIWRSVIVSHSSAHCSSSLSTRLSALALRTKAGRNGRRAKLLLSFLSSKGDK